MVSMYVMHNVSKLVAVVSDPIYDIYQNNISKESSTHQKHTCITFNEMRLLVANLCINQCIIWARKIGGLAAHKNTIHQAAKGLNMLEFKMMHLYLVKHDPLEAARYSISILSSSDVMHVLGRCSSHLHMIIS